ncbi:flagellar basal body rod protein FlgB [mine drainage metagenome]|jgi:flagellar basal-body rod protein FlgB|uniref:Flagellar basal body rod protein FlgB n=1 Tax=mine drainage metagenome TaxID=410659 RepID=A0A1J5QBN7_9ZZZZ
MINSIDKAFAFQEKALSLQGYRQQLLASNIANADTPNYKAVDIDFAAAMRRAQSGMSSVGMTRTSAGHMDGRSGGALAGVTPQYRTSIQPSIDGNTVDTNIEQGQFAQNSLQYLSTLQFINADIQSETLALKP